SLDLRRPGALVEAGAAALRTTAERYRALDERPDERLHRVDVLRQERLLDPRDESLVGDVQLLDPDLAGFLVEEGVEFLLGVLADRFVEVKAYRREGAHVPAIGAVAG